MNKEWKTLRLAKEVEEINDFESRLYLDKVPLTDHYEWTVWVERVKPNNNYSKNFGWFHSEKEANDCFNDILKNNRGKVEVLNFSDPHAVVLK